jgi:hypothetical protein
MRPLVKEHKTNIKFKKVLDINGNKLKESKSYQKNINFKNNKRVVEYWPILKKHERGIHGHKYIISCINSSYEEFLSTDILIWCDETSEWEYKDKVVLGIYDHNKKGTMIFREFITVMGYTSIEARDLKDITYIINETVAFKEGYIPCKHGDYFMLKKSLDKSQKIANSKCKTFYLDINTTHNADHKNLLFNKIQNIHKFYYKDYKGSTTEEYANKLLGNLSFGVEFETSRGSIQKSFLGHGGIIPLIDGSLNSRQQYEYTTVPLSGVSGLNTLKKVCKRLNEQCYIDRSCALHVHIGSLPNNKIFLISLYHLFERIQEELFDMIPAYKKDEINIMGKSRNYSEPIRSLGIENNSIFSGKGERSEKQVNKYLNEIYHFLSCGQQLDENYDFNTRGTYRTPWNRQWNCPTRYFAMNLVNYFFSESGTVEFRLHSPTLNFTKTSCWLYICIAIIRYANTYAEKILNRKSKITLRDIISEYRTNFGLMTETSGEEYVFNVQFTNFLISYIDSRKVTFRENYIEVHKASINRNKYSLFSDTAKREFKNDKKYSFSYSRKKELY